MQHDLRWYHKHATELAKKITRERANGICVKCGGNGQLHGSHVLSQGAYPNMSANLNNIIPLCARCHGQYGRTSWHNEPAANIKWFEQQWPGRLDKLFVEARNLKPDWELIYKELKNE